MNFNPYARQRRSTRLPKFDYTQNGAYFITICTRNRVCLFGKIDRDIMLLNEFGKIASDAWQNINTHFPCAIPDLFVVMPNHVHGIINLTDDRGRDIACYVPTEDNSNRFSKLAPGSVSAIIRSYKSAVSKSINEICRTTGTSVWQPKYYEHVIRDETDLFSIREYIQFNPQKWLEDNENPTT